MNKTQREYLIGKIKERFTQELEDLIRKEPKAPDLNNHLIVAFSSGNIEFADIDTLRENLRNLVLNMANGDKLIESSSRAWRSSDSEFLKLPPEYLIKLPDIYTAAMEKYSKDLLEYNKAFEKLNATMLALETKIMLASDDALRSLIDEAGTLVELSLINDQLLLK